MEGKGKTSMEGIGGILFGGYFYFGGGYCLLIFPKRCILVDETRRLLFVCMFFFINLFGFERE